MININDNIQDAINTALTLIPGTTVDTVADGCMNAVTSNAVYDSLAQVNNTLNTMNAITTGTIVEIANVCVIRYVRVGRVVIFAIYVRPAGAGVKTLPFDCVFIGEGIKGSLLWAGECRGEAYLTSKNTITINCTDECSGQLICIVES